MKTIILAGGLGTRLAEYTNIQPKPMVEIGGKPILWHILNIYSRFGYNEFIIALGYKGDVIKEYFLKYYTLNNDFTIDLNSGVIEYIKENKILWKITLVETGDNSMTGGRVKRIQSLIGNETFMLTYGDAVSNVNICDLIQFHKSHGKIGTVTAVHPPARFGEISFNTNNNVESFKEKPQTNLGWINGGFFVFEPKIFEYIDGDQTVLEKEPLEKLASNGNLFSFKHEGFWQSMDTVRDRKLLEEIYKDGKAPWLNK